jgi:hypothetical protein
MRGVFWPIGDLFSSVVGMFGYSLGGLGDEL